jgi:hypothetical protein
MAWKKAKDEKPKEGEKTEVLQPKLGKQYELCVNQMGTNNYGPWYLVEDENGKEWFLPNHKDLRSKLRQFKDLAEGDYILIEYIKDKDIGKENPLRIYDVYWDDGEGD